MVATVTQLTSASRTAEYFEQEGYYAKTDPEHKKASRWHGRGAAALGLRRHVSPARLTAILDGRPPGTDITLGRIRDGEREHRPGLDITMQAPKSVSLAALVSGDGRIIRAHDEAVRETLDFIEAQLLLTRRWDRKARRHIRVPAPSMVAACFRHQANRNLEPHLHTHAVIANMTRGPDDSWSSLELGPLGPAAKLIGAHYRNVLAARLMALGYALRPSMVGRVPGFEIEGYDRPLIELASSRRREIMDWIRSRGLANTVANRQKAAYATRKFKDEPHHLELEARWRSQARQMGIARKPPRPAAARRRQARDAEHRPGLLEIITRCVAQLAERSSVFREADLCMLALAHSPGLHSYDGYVEARDQLKRDGHLVEAQRRGQGPCLVTSQTLRAEREIIAMMKGVQGTGRPLAGTGQVGAVLAESRLTDGQQAAVRAILLGEDGCVGIQGHAGTGKTAMLRAVKGLAGDHKLIALAPSAAAARSLAAEAGLAARTLQGFLARCRDVAEGVASKHALARLREAFAGAVIILDEASMTSTMQMRDLMRIAGQLGIARLVLIGDEKQLRAVEAGQPFRQLQGAGMPTAHMDEILRQRSLRLKEAVTEIIAGKPMQAIGRLGSDVHEVELGDLGRKAGELWLRLDDADRDATVILAPTHEIRAEVGETVRQGLAEEGHLRGPELEVERLISRSMTREAKGDIRNWSEGDQVVFHHDLWGGKAHAGECFTVLAIEGERAVLVHADGRQLTVRPGGKNLRYQLELYETAPIRIREGDRIRWTRNDHDRGLVNGGQARILGIGPKRVRIMADGRELRLSRDDVQLRHIDHAYSSTVHGAQGITADRVIAVLDSGHGALTDQATFYVEVSRARDEVVILTDNREQLAETLEERPGLRMTALEAIGEDVARAVIPDKAAAPAAEAALTQLAAAAGREGMSILDMPEFGEVGAQLRGEASRRHLADGYRRRIEAHLARIDAETARREELEGFATRCQRAIIGLDADAAGSVANAEGLASEAEAMLESPDHAPLLGQASRRRSLEAALSDLKAALAGGAARAAIRDWQGLLERAEHDGALPIDTGGHDELMARIWRLAAEQRVPAGTAAALGTIIAEDCTAEARRRQVLAFREQAERNRQDRRVLFVDSPGRQLPQQQPAYAAWRLEAEELHQFASRMSRERTVWEPHLAAIRWGMGALRSWLARLANVFRRDDRVRGWAREDPVPGGGKQIAGPVYPIRAAGDLVLGDKIRWAGRQGGMPPIREGQITGVAPGITDAGETYEIRPAAPGDDIAARPVFISGRDLFRGDFHRKRWPDEAARDAFRAEPAGRYSVACKSGEAVLVGDLVRWCELVPDSGEDEAAGPRDVVAKIVMVTPGPRPEDDQLRLRILRSTGAAALPAGTVLEVTPGRLCQAGQFHRVTWECESDRERAAAALTTEREQLLRERDREAVPDRSDDYGMSM